MNCLCYIFRFTGIGLFVLTCISVCYCTIQGSVCNNELLKEKEICCGNIAHNETSDNGRKLKCCQGKDLYDPTEQECCGTSLLPKDDNMRCCREFSDETQSINDRIFDKRKNEVCCGNVVSQLPFDCDLEDYICCGTTSINKKQRHCCKSELAPKNQSIVVLGKNEECCGAVKYNDTRQWCNRNSNSETVCKIGEDLCGHTLYNVTQEVCCDIVTGHVEKIPTQLSSCKSQHRCYILQCHQGHVFNPNTQEWNEKLQRFIPLGFDVCGMEEFNPAIKACCGDKLHNLSNQFECCGGKWMDSQSYQCCNSIVINPTVEACCGQTMNIRRSPENDCCGRSSYNPTKEVCCSLHSDTHSIKKGKPNDTKCCTYTHPPAPYNDLSEVCKEKVGIQKVEDNSIQLENPNENTLNAIETPKVKKSPFCSTGKKTQIEKTCDKRNAIQAYVVDIDKSRKKRLILHVIILNPKSMRGLVGRWRVNVRAKCIKRWDNEFVWLFTNRRHRGNKRNTTLRITERDLLLKDTPKNKRLRSRICRQSKS